MNVQTGQRRELGKPMTSKGRSFDRRQLLRIGAGGAALTGIGASLPLLMPEGKAAPDGQQVPGRTPHLDDDHVHNQSVTVGDIDVRRMRIDPTTFATHFDYGNVSTMADGTVVREWDIVAVDREIEIAPGVFFPAWTYNGQVPGPTLRCNEGERLRVNFVNNGEHPHSLHFHGIHASSMDGVPGIGRGDIEPGAFFTYDLPAKPFGVHLYHCHTAPLKRHVHKGLYGAFIVNPDPTKRGEKARSRHPDYIESAEWQEFVMVMNAFDTNFDAENEVYAVNSVAFHYMKHPLPVQKGRPVRVYLINLTEFDLMNSLHLHANFFDYYDTGTQLEPNLRTIDTISLAQGQRGIMEFSYDDEDHEPGLYMFHAHVSEFAELGWMSAFDVRE
jgi:FtsP/CotA-like multicopper oxidase with cupredoxin domain